MSPSSDSKHSKVTHSLLCYCLVSDALPAPSAPTYDSHVTVSFPCHSLDLLHSSVYGCCTYSSVCVSDWCTVGLAVTFSSELCLQTDGNEEKRRNRAPTREGEGRGAGNPHPPLLRWEVIAPSFSPHPPKGGGRIGLDIITKLFVQWFSKTRAKHNDLQHTKICPIKGRPILSLYFQKMSYALKIRQTKNFAQKYTKTQKYVNNLKYKNKNL